MGKIERSGLAHVLVCCGVTIAVGCGSANEDVVDEATVPGVHENGYEFSFGGGSYGPPIYLQPPIPSYGLILNPVWGYGGGGGSSSDAGVKDSAPPSDGGTTTDAGASDAGSAGDAGSSDSGSSTTSCAAAGDACLYQGTAGTCVDNGSSFGFAFYTCQPDGPTACTSLHQRCYTGTEFGTCMPANRWGGLYCLPDSECSGAGDTCLTDTGAAGYCFSISLTGYECREAVPCTTDGAGCFDANGWGTCVSSLSGGLDCWHSGGLSYGPGSGGGYYYSQP